MSLPCLGMHQLIDQKEELQQVFSARNEIRAGAKHGTYLVVICDQDLDVLIE